MMQSNRIILLSLFIFILLAQLGCQILLPQTPTAAADLHIRPTATIVQSPLREDGCIHWTEATEEMWGQEMCIYGQVKQIVKPREEQQAPVLDRYTKYLDLTNNERYMLLHDFHIILIEEIVPDQIDIKADDCISASGVLQNIQLPDWDEPFFLVDDVNTDLLIHPPEYCGN